MGKSKITVRGTIGEDLTANYLKRNGFKIITRNYHSRYGEIDIVAVDKELILFVEVKTRSEFAIERPAVAVNLSKQRKIIRTALIFLSEHEYDLQPRFDVSEVTLDSHTDMFVDLNYIENAFYTEE